MSTIENIKLRAEQPARVIVEGTRQGWGRDARITIRPAGLGLFKVKLRYPSGREDEHEGRLEDLYQAIYTFVATHRIARPTPFTADVLKQLGIIQVQERRRVRRPSFNSVSALPPREMRVGFSEIAAVMGVSPFKSPLELWREKVGLERNDEPSFTMKLGTAIEKSVLMLWKEEYAAQGHKIGRTYTKVKAADGPLAGELDAIVRVDDEFCVVEIKVASGYHAHEAYKLQVNAQLGATGLRKGLIVTLVNNKYISTQEVIFDEELYRAQKEAAERFLVAVRTKKPPLDEPLAEAHIKGDDAVAVEDENAEVVQLMRRIKELSDEVEGKAEELEEAKKKLKLALETASVTRLATRYGTAELKIIESERLDTKALKAEHPELAERYIKKTTYTQLKLKLL